MFFWLSKTVDLLCSPLFVSLVLALLAANFGRRSQARRAWICGGAAFMVSYLFATTLVAGPLFDWVEQYDGPDFREGEKYDAVIVLGGFLSGDMYGRLALSEGGDRFLRGYELLHSGQARYGLISADGLYPDSKVEADAVASLLTYMGIEKERLLLERRSVNTRQNALETRAIVRAKKLERLVLVTSAFHMERALQCFRAVGLEPDALPCDNQSPWADSLFQLLAPRAAVLAKSELAIRELVGRLVYRLMGYAKPRSSQE